MDGTFLECLKNAQYLGIKRKEKAIATLKLLGFRNISLDKSWHEVATVTNIDYSREIEMKWERMKDIK